MIPRENDQLWGHAKEYDNFKQAIVHDKLHHAWLVCGEEGVGKTTFVYHIIRLILGKNSAAINRIKTGSHADLLTITRRFDEKKNRFRSEIVLEDIKLIGDFLRLTPAEGGWRIVVIEKADLMNRNAANSLLKILEEPPKAALLFLITAHPNRLLPTILSRCRKLVLHPLSNTDLQKGLAELAPHFSEKEQQKIIPLAQGSLGKALQLLENHSINLQNIVDDFFTSALHGKELYQKIEIILQNENGFSIFLDLLTDSLNQRIAHTVKAQQNQFGNPLHTIPEWIKIWQILLKWHKDTEVFNLDKKQTLISEFKLVSEL